MPSSATTAMLVSLLSIALVVAGAGNSAASIMEQVDEAVTHADALVEDVRAEPATAVANATNSSWQGGEINWTVAWSCDTVAVLSEDGEAQLEAHGVCPEADDAHAGEPAAQAGHSETHVVPRSGDPSVAEQVNDTIAFVDEVLDDPSSTTDRLEAYVNRTVRFVRHLLGLPGEAFDAVRGIIGDAASAIEGLGETIGGAAVELTRTIGSTLRDAGDTVADTGKQTWSGVAELGRDTASAVGELAREIVRLTKAPLREIGDATGDVDRMRPPSSTDGLLDGLDDVDGLLP